MSDEVKNQPAFPQHSWQRVEKVEVGECMPGMALRDYFAAKAMQGYLAAGTHRVYKNGAELTLGISGAAYELADAMLKARVAE